MALILPCPYFTYCTRTSVVVVVVVRPVVVFYVLPRGPVIHNAFVCTLSTSPRINRPPHLNHHAPLPILTFDSNEKDAFLSYQTQVKMFGKLHGFEKVFTGERPDVNIMADGVNMLDLEAKFGHNIVQ